MWLSNRSVSLLCCTLGALAALVMLREVQAGLEPENVLLLYNGQDAESQQIKAAYVAAHPGVHALNLDLVYQDPPDAQNPPALAVNKYYITPLAFTELVQAKVLEYVAAHSTAQAPIVAIATTRGLPACVSSHFAPPANHSNQYLKASFEARLARGTLPGDMGFYFNPYYSQVGVGFKEFATQAEGWCLSLIGKMFLACRLDSDVPDSDVDGDGDIDHVDGVKALIERSRHLTANPTQCTMVYDASAGGLGLNMVGNVASNMWDLGWSVHYDRSEAFLHGADDPSRCKPAIEGQYTGMPELVHYGLGKNHIPNNAPGDEVTRFYVRSYRPAPAGLFISHESFNGITLRTPWHLEGGTEDWRQGQVLHWIAKGGSFTIGHVNGVSAPADLKYAQYNLYVKGLSWAEAAYSSLYQLDHFYTPVGDPLAEVQVRNPDFNGDHAVNGADLGVFIYAWGVGAGPADLNGDGVVEGADLGAFLHSWGWVALQRPDALPATPPFPQQDLCP